MSLLWMLAACSGPDEAIEAEVGGLSDAALLSRISLDVRGVRPPPEDLDAVDADPTALDGLVEEYLADERFEDRVRDLFAEVYLTRSELFEIAASSYGLDEADNPAFLASVGEEPLRILGYLAANDLPYTDLVTADWTMADELLATAYPVDYPEGATGWQRVAWTDGRPAAGVLATNAMWLRYSSTDSNANRKRANATSRILLCEDYLVRPIDFDRNINLLDEEAVNDALQNNAACSNCHNSLDPLAAYFWGFWTYYGAADEVVSYHPERELLWQDATGVSPAYYGVPGSSLADLGQQIAADPRFPQCAVEQVTRLLLRRELTLADTDALVAHREAFLLGDLTLRALFRSVLSDPNYRAADPEAEGAMVARLVTPELLTSQIEDLTGFRWSYYDYDMMRTDIVGLRTLAGGADGVTVTANATRPSTTLVLVQERLAEAAASYAVQTELAMDMSDRHIFSLVDGTETPETDHAAIVAQIQRLHRLIFGAAVDADGPEVEANLALWSDLYAVDSSPGLAWQGLLTALLRDPDLLVY